MTPEIIARVDAWLVENGERINSEAHGAWRGLVDEWERVPGHASGVIAERCFAILSAAMTGFVLYLVREAWGDPTIFVRSIPGRDRGPESLRGGWKMTDAEGSSLWCDAGPLPGAATEVEALVAALEAAPAKGAE